MIFGCRSSGKYPANCSAEVPSTYSVMVSDVDVGDRRVGGISASMYLLTVSLWIPSSLAIPQMDGPLRFALYTAFHLSLGRKEGFPGEAETVIAATSLP